MPSALCVHFEDSTSDTLEAVFDQPQDCELFQHLREAFEHFSVTMPIAQGKEELDLRWSIESLVVDDDEHEVFPKSRPPQFRLRFMFFIKARKEDIKQAMESIKEKIIEICTSCGCYSEVLVQG
jgi:hypothetical protein